MFWTIRRYVAAAYAALCGKNTEEVRDTLITLAALQIAIRTSQVGGQK